MNRKGFMSKLFAFGGLYIVPKQWTKTQKKVILLNGFIAGFQYYEGPQLLSSMKTGDTLELVRESENKYDDCAIALGFKGRKIGFIPASENDMLSKLLDNDLLEIKGEVTAVKLNAMPWEQVSFGIYSYGK